MGIEEQKQGTPRHQRYAADLAAATDLLSFLDLADYSICDCYRLGCYYHDSDKSRPLLVKMNRSGDVACIKSQRVELATKPGISIKPDLTHSERGTYSVRH